MQEKIPNWQKNISVVKYLYVGALIGLAMTFYEALVIAMDERGMKPADICAKTGIYQSYISKLKSGHMKDVGWEKAVAIIQALGMTPDEFYELQMSDKKNDQTSTDEMPDPL